MILINWTAKEKVNLTKIDFQHKILIDIINEVYANLDLAVEDQKNLLYDFVNQLKIHFETEENYMKEYKYLNYISHKLEHDRCYRKIRDSIDNILNDKAILKQEFFISFKNWFYNHLDFNDRKCAEYLRSKGVT